MRIGSYDIDPPIILAPMAGVTDLPFRKLCKRLGAGLVVSEMVTSDPSLRNTRKTQLRLNHDGESEPRSVQIAGTDPQRMAEAAQFNVENGAQIIDINMGCPAKKVCNVQAGSALMRNEKLVAEILHATVNAVDVPITLKIRTGWDDTNINAPQIAKIAEDMGIQSLAIHGRTRTLGYKGQAEYDTIAEIKQNSHIPIVANGDILTPERAKYVFDYTQADAIMIGRGAQGRPWIFKEIQHFIKTGNHLEAPSNQAISEILVDHVKQLHRFYGEFMGLRVARKHIAWYCKNIPEAASFRQRMNKIESADEQLNIITHYFQQLG